MNLINLKLISFQYPEPQPPGGKPPPGGGHPPPPKNFTGSFSHGN